MIPARTVVTPAFPRVTQRDEPVDTRPAFEEELETRRGRSYEIIDRDTSARQFGDGVSEHRGLGDG